MLFKNREELSKESKKWETLCSYLEEEKNELKMKLNETTEELRDHHDEMKIAEEMYEELKMSQQYTEVYYKNEM